MARKWSAWTAGSALTGTEKFPGLDGSADPNKTWLASQLATYITALIVDAAPGTLDTLNELAAALGDDPNFAATTAASLALKAPLASPALTGTPTAPTASAGTSTTQIATAAFVGTAVRRGSHPGYVATRWYWPPDTLIGAGTAMAVNTIRLNPIMIPQAITVSDLAVKIVTLSAGGNIQLAVYAAHATTHSPTGTALAATGNISTAATGMISADIAGADVTLAAGLYWVAANSDNAVAVLAANLGGNSFGATLIGTATLANLSGASNSSANVLTVAQTFGTWPDLTAASYTEVPGTAETAVAFKVSAVP